jgi:hypothetical protein
LFAGYGDGHEMLFFGAGSAWIGGRVDLRVPVGSRFELGGSLLGLALQYEELECEFGGDCHVGRFVPFYPVFEPTAWGRAQVVELPWLRISPWVLGRAHLSLRPDDPSVTPEAVLGLAAAIGPPTLELTATVPAVATGANAESPVRWPLEDVRVGAGATIAKHHRVSVEVGWWFVAAGYGYRWEHATVGLRWATAGAFGNTAEIAVSWGL